MIPKRVVLENFLSFGPKTTIEFTDDEPLWVLGGPNGVGKSAVFDAITFCLFGAHRGGAKEIDPLIRHGANGFSVMFEFEFGGRDYRITRNRSGGRTTQSVEQRKPDTGTWERVPNVNTISGVKEWSEKTLGLGFEQFKASVMLRQGEADAIITAGGTERLKNLKKIIGAERYEELSKRVHEATRAKDTELARLKTMREKAPGVTEAELEAAQVAVQTAEAKRLLAEQQKDAAMKRIGEAKTFAGLEAKRAELAVRIAAADTRASDADRIRRDKARFDELNAVLPMLAQTLPLRESLDRASRRRVELHEQHQRAEAERDHLTSRCEGLRLRIAGHREAVADHAQRAGELRGAIDRQSKFLAAADELAQFDSLLKEFDPDLDIQAAEAAKAHAEAIVAERIAGDVATQFETQLKLAKKEQKQFESVEIGVKCSRCGQPVSAEHAEAERKRIAEAIAVLMRDHADATRKAEMARKALETAKAASEQFARRIAERNTVRQRRDDKRLSLESLGGTANADQLRLDIARLSEEAEAAERSRAAERDAQIAAEGELKQNEDALQIATTAFTSIAAELSKLDTTMTADTARLDTLTAQLPEAWRGTTAAQLPALSAELAGLKSARVEEQYRQLLDDAARRGEWQQQLDAHAAEIALIPESSRIPLADAERLERDARAAFTSAEGDWQQARETLSELRRRGEQFAELKREIEAAETAARIHGKLDDLLGKTGLQRELVRDAETQIVQLANDTVRQLSDGDLSIELDRSEGGDDEAFALRVRRADSPTPIAVAYLSGSQKFRVAISVALAIGRFAAGQARPLECVIIDEGFGSLDKDGLRAAADELNRLKQHLRRIVLVSHQDEFTDHFPVVIQLSKGDAGTIATSVRR